MRFATVGIGGGAIKFATVGVGGGAIRFATVGVGGGASRPASLTGCVAESTVLPEHAVDAVPK